MSEALTKFEAKVSNVTITEVSEHFELSNSLNVTVRCGLQRGGTAVGFGVIDGDFSAATDVEERPGRPTGQ